MSADPHCYQFRHRLGTASYCFTIEADSEADALEMVRSMANAECEGTIGPSSNACDARQSHGGASPA